MSLTKPALNALELERSALALWHEFLNGLFDGNNHSFGGHVNVPLPKAELMFQQFAPTQPMAEGAKATPLSIHVVWVMPSKPRRYHEHNPATGRRQEWATCRGQFLFYVRCSAVEDTAGNADYQCQGLSDRLHAVLENAAATLPLAEKGIHTIAPTTPAIVSKGIAAKGADASNDFAVRMMSVTCRLRYPILSQPE